MTNAFRDQSKFMKACDQTVGEFNAEQFNLYLRLIEEEAKELAVAIANSDPVETLDALIDILVVQPWSISDEGSQQEGQEAQEEASGPDGGKGRTPG